MTAPKPKPGTSALENWLSGGELVPGDVARAKPPAEAKASAAAERAMAAQDEVVEGIRDALGDEGLREWARRMASDPKTLPKLGPTINKILSLPQNTSGSKEFNLIVTAGAPVDFDPEALRRGVADAKRALIDGTMHGGDD